MRTVKILIDDTKFPDHTDDDFEKWIGFVTGHRGNMELSNPLHECELEAEYVSIEP
jgi:hypothetical protein